MTLRPHVLEIERTEDATDEARQLLAELDQALAGNYLPEQHHALSLEQLFRTNVRFFVARADGVAVGCGGVAFYDGFAEVKRMYTRPRARRLGVATGVLRRLEAEARRGGYSILGLETGRYHTDTPASVRSASARASAPSIGPVACRVGANMAIRRARQLRPMISVR